MIEDEVKTLFSSPDVNNCYSNLTPREQLALKDLAGDESIIIRNADKGGAVVLQNKVNYCAEVMKQLTNSDFYTPLSYDPTLTFSREIRDTLNWAYINQLIIQDEYKFLL